MKPKLLIVEDNVINAELNRLVCEMDFDCQVASNGKDGIRLLNWADYICVDGEFPHNTEFYAALKITGKPFVVYSGNDTCKGVGESEFILKPHIDKMLIALRRLL